MKKDQGARYAIEVNGVVRTHRDELTIAFDAAAVLLPPVRPFEPSPSGFSIPWAQVSGRKIHAPARMAIEACFMLMPFGVRTYPSAMR